MRLLFFILLYFSGCSFYAQNSNLKKINWEDVINNESTSNFEVQWLKDNLSSSDLTNVFELVSDLSRPAASQLLVSYFYLDGSFKKNSVKPYIDSLSIRPPDGDAGFIRVAYLASKLRKKRIELLKSNNFYVAEFSGMSLELPSYKETDINKNIKLSFDYQPARVIIDILSSPDMSYDDIQAKLALHQFDKLIDHRNQSFYSTPLNKERLISCLQIASSTKPIDKLYRYMNPDGLLYYTDVKTNLNEYKKQLVDFSKNEDKIFKYINASISPYLPQNTKFERKVSFFFINDADGWASGDVTALDLNYYKDNYEKLLPLLVHETYHSGQNAVAQNVEKLYDENVQAFVGNLDYLFGEGTASYIAPPSIKTQGEYESEITEGLKLMEEIFKNTIKEYDLNKAVELKNKGVASAGPFYWLGAEMSRVIVDELGKEQLADIIPTGGVQFFKTYFKAVKKENNLYSDALTRFIIENL